MSAIELRPGSESTALTWGLLGAAVCALLIQFEPNLLEEGLILHVAQRMRHGEHLYRDVASFTGPLPFEALAALFRLFGEHIVVARGAVVVLHGLACASVYAVAWRAGAGPLAHAAAGGVASAPLLLFPLFSLYFHTTLAFQLCLIAAWPAVRGTRSLAWAAATGVIVAGAALCKQTLGVALAAGLLVAVTAGAEPGRRRRTALALAAGGAGVAALTLAVYGVRGDLAVLVRSLVLLPLSFDTTFSAPFVNLWPPGEFGPEIQPNRGLYLPSLYTLTAGMFDDPPGPVVLLTQMLYALPFLALAATALRRFLGPLPAAVWVHTAVLLALMMNLFPRTDWGHLVFALPPAWVQGVLLVPPGRASRTPRRLWGAAAALGLVLVAADAWSARVILTTAEEPALGPHVPQRTVTRQLRSRSLARAVRYLLRRVGPGESIFVARAEPLLYFATDTRNPTPYSGVIPGMRDEQERAILAALDDVRYVVMTDIDQPLYTYYREQLPAVQRHLERHFRIPADFPPRRYNWVAVLEPGPDRGPTAIDLFDAREQGVAWIRDANGERRPPPGPTPKVATRMNRRPLTVLLGPLGGGIDFTIDVPHGATFQSGIGFEAVIGIDDFYKQAPESRLVVTVARSGGRPETLASVYLVDTGYKWKPLEVDLSAYGGERVTLGLELIPDAPLKPETDELREIQWVALWGSPRIALPPDSG